MGQCEYGKDLAKPLPAFEFSHNRERVEDVYKRQTFTGEGHFSVDEKARQVNLTERGLVLIEELLVQEGIMDCLLYTSSDQ